MEDAESPANEKKPTARLAPDFHHDDPVLALSILSFAARVGQVMGIVTMIVALALPISPLRNLLFAGGDWELGAGGSSFGFGTGEPGETITSYSFPKNQVDIKVSQTTADQNKLIENANLTDYALIALPTFLLGVLAFYGSTIANRLSHGARRRAIFNSRGIKEMQSVARLLLFGGFAWSVTRDLTTNALAHRAGIDATSFTFGSPTLPAAIIAYAFVAILKHGQNLQQEVEATI